MDERWDVAIVGGGVVGLAAGYELKRAGVDRVVVLEREPAVGQGQSARANGGFRAQFTTPTNIRFSQYSIPEMERLDRATGLLGMVRAGYLFVTGTPEGERSLRAAMELQRSLGVETRWLTGLDVAAAVPLLRVDGLLGGTFHASDGFFDPNGMVQAYAHEARRLGVAVRPHADVVAIRRAPNGDFEVDLGTASVDARWVVNAAGADAAKVALMVDAVVPVTGVRRHTAYFHDPSGARDLIPMCVDADTGVICRRDQAGGFLVAYADPTDASSETQVDPRFFEVLAERIGNRFPFLETCPLDVDQCWAGLYPETPDHHPIIGEERDVPRFVEAVGFGGHGLMHAPAGGRAVAAIVTGEPCDAFDIDPARPSRFEEGDLIVEGAVL